MLTSQVHGKHTTTTPDKEAFRSCPCAWVQIDRSRLCWSRTTRVDSLGSSDVAHSPVQFAWLRDTVSRYNCLNCQPFGLTLLAAASQTPPLINVISSPSGGTEYIAMCYQTETPLGSTGTHQRAALQQYSSLARSMQPTPVLQQKRQRTGRRDSHTAQQRNMMCLCKE